MREPNALSAAVPGTLDRLVYSSQNHVLKHLYVFGIDYLRGDCYREQLLLTIHHSPDRAAADCNLHRLLAQFSWALGHLLLQF